jgi:site-specific DNA-methyltransferase (adenine-specific)
MVVAQVQVQFLFIINLYNKLKNLNPTYLTMIIPARWYSGGRGLDEFRDEMLKDKRIKEIHDFPNTSDCFPGVKIKGGVCYFLWEKEYNGKTKVYTHEGGEIKSESERILLEKDAETFIRYNEAISILHKVQALKEKSFADMISANDPFGFDVRVDGSVPMQDYDESWTDEKLYKKYGLTNDEIAFIETLFVQWI